MPNLKKNIISKYNQEALNSYVEKLQADGQINNTSIQGYENHIKKVLHDLNKDYDKSTETDLNKVFSKMSPGQKYICKSTFKYFLTYHNLNDLADTIKINTNYVRKSKKTDNDVLYQDEIDLIRNSIISLREKAIIELFLTTGIRSGEFLSLKIQNITKDVDAIYVNITKSKSKNRRIAIIPNPHNPCAFYPTNFITYFETHPYKSDKNHSLFISVASNTYGKPLTKSGLDSILKKTKNKLNIKKDFTSHIFRHTSATWYGHDLTEDELRLRFGWSKTSNMPHIYCHGNMDSLDEKLKRLAGLTENDVKTHSQCPYCQTKININDKKCPNCQRVILTIEEYAQRESELQEHDKKLYDRINTLEQELKVYNDKVNSYEKHLEKLKNEFNPIITKMNSLSIDIIKYQIKENFKNIIYSEDELKKDKELDILTERQYTFFNSILTNKKTCEQLEEIYNTKFKNKPEEFNEIMNKILNNYLLTGRLLPK